MKVKQIIYAVVVFSIMGIALYVASSFEYYGFYEECKLESNTQGGIEACVEYKIEESKQ
ncbi:hypothetical protein N9M32_01960 [Alphaproteobacteria bacterium]|jgi:hypothetical protein|nr:hypothetical protein [Alphaproteobacteria bacterium]